MAKKEKTEQVIEAPKELVVASTITLVNRMSVDFEDSKSTIVTEVTSFGPKKEDMGTKRSIARLTEEQTSKLKKFIETLLNS